MNAKLLGTWKIDNLFTKGDSAADNRKLNWSVFNCKVLVEEFLFTESFGLIDRYWYGMFEFMYVKY